MFIVNNLVYFSLEEALDKAIELVTQGEEVSIEGGPEVL